jgi:hypothetical protein
VSWIIQLREFYGEGAVNFGVRPSAFADSHNISILDDRYPKTLWKGPLNKVISPHFRSFSVSN